MDTLDCFQKDCEKGFKPNNKGVDSFKQEMIQVHIFETAGIRSGLS